MAKTTVYDASSITVLEGLEAVTTPQPLVLTKLETG